MAVQTIIPLPPPGSAHPLGGRVFARSAAKHILIRQFLDRRPADIENFIRQSFGIRWIGDDDRDRVIAGWIAEVADIPAELLPY